MKTKLLISAVLFLVVAAFIFKTPSEKANNTLLIPPSGNPDKEFLINVMHSGIDTHYVYYPQLGTNTWHKYTGPPNWGWPGISNDSINFPTSEYRDAVIQRMDSNRNNGFRSVMDRPKIQYLAFGQRSDYQCEDSVDPDYWFYSYKDHEVGEDVVDNTPYGNGQSVRFCSVFPDAVPGYVVKNLRANREQANRYWPPWIADAAYAWYVMPRIRIDTSVIGINPNTKVCAIIVHDWNGNIIDSIDILAKYFRINPQTNYDGKYLEEFYFIPNQGPSAIEIDPGLICPGFRKDFGDWSSTNDTNTIKTDFRVYWYGQCNMWIDYVRVENQSAHQLFKGQWDNDIRQETDIALHGYDPNNPIPNNFYIEEFEFNTVSAISYVDSLIKQESSDKLSLMVNLNYPLFSVHIPWDANRNKYELGASYINNHLVAKAHLKYLVNVSYPLEGFDQSLGPQYASSEHPSTLSNSDYSPTSEILSHKVSVSTYENWLQDKIDFGRGAGDGFMKIMKKTDSISKYYSTDLNLIHLEQAHLIWTPGHKLKEPSNEEMKLMASLAITYGAKGIMFFAYNSDNAFTNTSYYQRGLTDTNQTPRHQSVYGQDNGQVCKR